MMVTPIMDCITDNPISFPYKIRTAASSTFLTPKYCDFMAIFANVKISLSVSGSIVDRFTIAFCAAAASGLLLVVMAMAVESLSDFILFPQS